MFSPNQLYDYLRYQQHIHKKNTTVRYFITNGSKNLLDLTPTQNIFIENDLLGNNPDSTRENTGCIDMFDQEPVDIHTYYNVTFDSFKNERPNAIQLNFGVNDFVFSRAMSIYTPIICHSERNSTDILTFSDNFYSTVHFWSNAILSRYWFAHYELLLRNNLKSGARRIGTYIRDTSGTRTYREKLLNYLKTPRVRRNVFCPALDGVDNIPSYASASIPWPDHTKFDIHIVPETLYDTDKIHLTEKIFKAIVMHQPFILFASAHSLKYLKSYGFRTFDHIWDESYDEEHNADIRFNKITNLIDAILKLDRCEYNKLMKQTETIVQFNRKHFYSEKFKTLLLNELNDNLTTASNEQEEKFYSMPGGTLFHYHNLYYTMFGKKPSAESSYLEPSIHNALKYAYSKSKSVGDAIVKKYSHLL